MGMLGRKKRRQSRLHSVAQAVVDQPSQFDFYDGGGLDITILGAAQVDAEGSVNVSQLPGRLTGVGGFVNISTNAKRVVFCCALRAGALELKRDQAGVHVLQEGKHPKFIKKLSSKSICFHGPSALDRGQEVLYVTERAVFKLTRGGLELQEVAPGMDFVKDILPALEFTPEVNANIKAMEWTHFDE